MRDISKAESGKPFPIFIIGNLGLIIQYFAVFFNKKNSTCFVSHVTNGGVNEQ
jgi:hypothetical protein